MGMPKGLVTDPDGTSWLARSVQVLLDGGCTKVSVVLGAASADVRLLVPRGVSWVVADDWEQGMGASLRAGLESLASSAPWATAALVHLVDLPDVRACVISRVLGAGADTTSLARAAYDGKPGHPVLLGRDHWAPVSDAAVGDQGARTYLAAQPTVLVECGDLATGHDVDHR